MSRLLVRAVAMLRAWHFLLVPIVLLGSVVAVGIAAQPPSKVPDRLDAGWLAIDNPMSSDVEHAESLGQLVRSADLVVVATIQSVERGRTVGNTSEPCRYGCSVAYYANATLKVERLVSGEPAYEGNLELDLLMTELDQLKVLRDSLEGQRGLFILRNKGENARVLGLSTEVQRERTRYYRLVSSQALYRDDGGKVRLPVGANDQFVLAQHGRDFADLVAEVASLSRS